MQRKFIKYHVFKEFINKTSIFIYKQELNEKYKKALL